MCCSKQSACRRHEKQINVPELIAAGGCLYPHRAPFSLSWLYTRFAFWIIISVINLFCYISCSLDTTFYSYFLYYNNWVLILNWIYFSLSLILSIKIYQNTQPYHLPSCLQPLNQYARSNIMDLPSIQNLNLSLLHKYTLISFHLSITNIFVLCFAYWTVEFAHSIHDFTHFYRISMKVNVIINYFVVFLLVLCEYLMNARRLRYSALWYIWGITLIFHVWSSVFDYNAFMYTNDNDNVADISKIPRLFIYYNWDQTPIGGNDSNLVTHSIGYMLTVSIVLYSYIAVVHVILCFVKSLFLYRWSRRNAVSIENAFDTEVEFNELSDATELEDNVDSEDVLLKQSVVGSGFRGKGEEKVYAKYLKNEVELGDTGNLRAQSTSPGKSLDKECEMTDHDAP